MVGDKVIEFGSVTSDNFSTIQDISNVVQHSEGVSIIIIITIIIIIIACYYYSAT